MAKVKGTAVPAKKSDGDRITSIENRLTDLVGDVHDVGRRADRLESRMIDIQHIQSALCQTAMGKMPDGVSGEEAGRWCAGFLKSLRENMAQDKPTPTPAADPEGHPVPPDGEQATPAADGATPPDVE